MKNEKLLTDFFNYMKDRRTSKRTTLDTYRYHLNTFEKYLEMSDVLLNDFIREDVKQFVLHQEEKGYSVSTIQDQLKVIRIFSKYLYKHKEIERMRDVCEDIKPTKKVVTNTAPKSIDRNQQNALLRLVADDSKYYAIFRILLNCGLRVSELVSLDVKNIDLSHGVNRIRFIGKGGVEREVHFNDETRRAIQKWLEAREELLAQWEMYNKQLGYDTEKALFLSNKGTRLGVRAIQDKLEKLGTERVMQMPKGEKLTPHMLRHTCFTRMVENGATIQDIQAVSGHSDRSIASLLRYTRSTSKKAAKFLEDM